MLRNPASGRRPLSRPPTDHPKGAVATGCEQAATGAPLIYTYILDPATGSYRTGEMFTGVVAVSAPFAVEIDLGRI